MNCPVCKTTVLAPQEIGSNVTAQKCPTCGGQWINSEQFWNWLQGHRAVPHVAASASTLDLPITESKGAKICPECARVMAKYKVGHSLTFSLDRCGNCGGTWFDKNEWEILQSGDLRDQVHLIFSEAWQSRVRDEERAKHLQELFIQKIGATDFEEAKRIRAWLNQHPHRQEIVAYLTGNEF